MKRGQIVALLILSVLVIVSAYFTYFSLTGKASSSPQDVSITVQANRPPAVNYVQDIVSSIPLEAGVRNVILEVHVRDQDGVNNIDDSSVDIEAVNGASRQLGSCVLVSDIDTRTANYSCTIPMQYYNPSGNWIVNASGRDLQNNYAENTSETFSYTLLSSFATPLTPSTLNWPALTPGSSNQASSNDPTGVTNTGNYEGNIFITAYNLVGETDPLENIPATAFSVSGIMDSECTGTALGPDGVSVNTGIPSNPGGAAAQIYYCIPSVPSVTSQTYSTVARGFSWVVEYV